MPPCQARPRGREAAPTHGGQLQGAQQRPRRQLPAARAKQRHEGGGGSGGGDQLASEFSAHINRLGLSLRAPLQHRRPSPLDPPTAAVAAQLDSLQVNDWPEENAGVWTAYAYSKPYECERLLVAGGAPVGAPRQGDGGSGGGEPGGTRVRSWAAAEQWLTPQQFAEMLHSPPFDVLICCDQWRACSEMVFPATRVGQRAVQAVEVLAAPRSVGGGGGGSSGGGSSGGGGGSSGGVQGPPPVLHKYTFTFCLELIAAGPYKGCWLTTGVRPGNYAL